MPESTRTIAALAASAAYYNKGSDINYDLSICGDHRIAVGKWKSIVVVVVAARRRKAPELTLKSKRQHFVKYHRGPIITFRHM